MMWFEFLSEDARFALRTLGKEPLFTAVAFGDTGAWHRREHGGVQRGEDRSAESVAVPRS